MFSSGLIYVYLSGAHKTIPKAEVMAIAEAEGIEVRPVLDLDQLLVLYSSPELVEFLKLRSAYSRRIGRVLWVGRVENVEEGAAEVAEKLGSGGVRSVKLEFRDLKGFDKERNYEAVRRSLVESGLVLGGDSGIVLDAIVSQEVVVLGLRQCEVRLKDFFSRWTNRRPVYLPGALNPDISRVFVNLSRASLRRSTAFYDPLCGVGSFLLEACYMGLKYSGSDIDERSVRGAAKNLESYGCLPEVFLADVCRMPASEVGAIGTDMPYGRQTKPRGGGAADLVKCLVENSESSLRRGSYLVFAQSSELERDVYRVVGRYDFEIVEVHQNWVHGSLTRTIYVLKRV
ncbi:MAG: hypothetical protein RMH84_01510 [Sulfolobales archaeon]|nr:hypothetical protein [Sulfolobales archaeon]